MRILKIGTKKNVESYSYRYTLGEFWSDFSNWLFRYSPYVILGTVGLILYYTFLIEGDNRWMSSWFSDSTKRIMRNVLEYLLLTGIGAWIFSFLVDLIIVPLFSMFCREWHNYTVLAFVISIISLGLDRKIPNYWDGFVAYPGLIFIIMLCGSAVFGIYDMVKWILHFFNRLFIVFKR